MLHQPKKNDLVASARPSTPDGDVFLAYLTALTLAVPPGLVACLSVSTSISISCTHKINVFVSFFEQGELKEDDSKAAEPRFFRLEGAAGEGDSRYNAGSKVRRTLRGS